MKFKFAGLISLFAGVLLVFAFAPVHFIWLAVICPAILYALLIRYDAIRAGQLGYIFGVGFFGVGASWVFVSIYYFGGTTIWISSLITVLFVLVLASFFAFMGFFLQRYFPKKSLVKTLCVYPALWALLEALRAWIFSGFPWLLLGHAAVNSVFSGLIPIFGAYGTSYFLVFIGGLFFLASVPDYGRLKFSGWQLSNLALITLILLVGAAYGLTMIHWTTPAKHPWRVSLVQGNIAQNLRWSAGETQVILNTYQSLTATHIQSDLIVWPEAAIPLTPREAQSFFDQIRDDLAPSHSALITGIPYLENNHYYNAIIGLGAAQGLYSKRHLVPFGEYVPYEQYLRGLIHFFDLPMSDFVPGKLQQKLIKVHGVPVGTYLCYEVAYSNIVRQDLPEAGLLMTLSDDAWFGKSLAPWQHLQIAQFAALATGRQMLFVSNNGVTAIINNKGQLQSILPQFTTNVLNGLVDIYAGSTPWVIIGDLPWLILMLIFLLIYTHRSSNAG